ncbi:MAG: pseudouridine-5'-phosphate glycosidase [Actinobacteria bacterium]|nr:MAG: pseudouridine-5'-phosphate glycosidase [Actinomycetota bacterium]
MTHHLQIAPEVRAALDAGAPVVALESTIISHGFPYPANLECALAAEETARSEGAVPATIALIGGEIRVGLDSIGLEHLATAPGIAKVSRRDLATLVARGSDGATTVAATMMIAGMAGIQVFATGGIGGVHRGAETSFDISADLEELARTDVAVVCAGAKSVLDLGLTLEYLETHGVPVLGHRTDEFPAFYTRTSGFGVDARLDSAEEIAAILRTRQELGVAGGVVVANPIPPEFELPHAQIDGVIEAALAEASEHGVRGKAVTPFLLGRIHSLTGGASEVANKELVYNNVRLAARIAGALSEGAR